MKHVAIGIMLAGAELPVAVDRWSLHTKTADGRHQQMKHVAIGIMLAACGGQPPAGRPTPASPDVELPVVVDNHRWFLHTKTADGRELRLYLDSAGGMYLTEAAAARLNLAVAHVKSEQGEMDAVAFPPLADPRIPRPQTDQLPVLAPSSLDDHDDGMLGAPWFAGHTFTFDYPNQRLVLRAPGALPPVAAAHLIEVGFPRNAAGEPTSPYGRISMIVEGQRFDMLFDTGATVDLTESARAALGGAARRATSFITQTVFDAWHAAHPAWRVVEGADRNAKGAPMIEVPKLTVGGFEVGPVWFTQRADRNFHEWMAQWMDKPTEGALGGSAFASLRITVDWVRGRAAFER